MGHLLHLSWVVDHGNNEVQFNSRDLLDDFDPARDSSYNLPEEGGDNRRSLKTGYRRVQRTTTYNNIQQENMKDGEKLINPSNNMDEVIKVDGIHHI